MPKFKLHASPGTVIGVVALVAALGGGAYAAIPGPQGVQGDKGDKGDPGDGGGKVIAADAGPRYEIAKFELFGVARLVPAGSWLVIFNVNAEGRSADPSLVSQVECWIESGGTKYATTMETLASFYRTSFLGYSSVTAVATITLPAADGVFGRCRWEGGEKMYMGGRLTAQQVSSLDAISG